MVVGMGSLLSAAHQKQGNPSGGALGAELATTRGADRILCAQGCLQLTWAGAVGRSPDRGHPRGGVRAFALARPSLCEQQLYVQAHTLRHQSALPC